ncbi:MAG: GTPase [Thiohalocapsa sp.]
MEADPTAIDPGSRALAWAAAEVPTIWLLGKTQAGKTSVVAEITGQAHDQIGTGFVPMTRESRLYAFPEDDPALRFLDTRGLSDAADYDPSADLTDARERAHLIMVVARVDDLELTEVLDTLGRARRLHPNWALLVAQTTLHNCYGRHDRHPEPYPFDGTDDDGSRWAVPDALRRAMLAQRRLFERLPGAADPIFIPLDFTRPEQGLPPSDYGAERLWQVLETQLPEIVAGLKTVVAGQSEQRLRAKDILPWSFAAAATNAVPLPVLGGLGSASLQALMVRQIARRCGFRANLDLWSEFVSALGVGFALGFGGRWLLQQVAKLSPGWGSAMVASWTFAITWGIGEAAVYYFTEKAAGRAPGQQELTQRYHSSLKEARSVYHARKRAHS